MNPEGPVVLPRPNLGPEPWPDSTIWPWPLVVVTLFILGLVFLRSRRRRVASPPPAPAILEPIETTPAPLDDRLRLALIAVFGASWRARTTEEILASGEISERFGHEIADRIGAYLLASDRARFSHDPAGPSDDLQWWAEQFIEETEKHRSNITTS